jgi:hypothetical protein
MVADDWNLEEMTDSARQCRLLGSVSPQELLERVEAEAKEVAANNTVCVHWRAATEQKGYWRVESTVPLTVDTFDLLFNGRMGYRAQYCRSVEDGRVFNRRLVNVLTPMIRTALENGQCSLSVEWNQVEQSLKGSHSKVWVAGDWAAFIHELEALKPARWVAYWSRRQDKALGLAAPLPGEPALDLKGTFICDQTGNPWLLESKKDRDQKIYCSGWT